MSLQHVISRARERYGISLNDKDVCILLKKIGLGLGKKIRTGAKGDIEWDIRHQGRTLRVVTVPADGDPTKQRMLIASIVPGAFDGFRLGVVAKWTNKKEAQ
jgi:hypothetical protein